jgi:hypothetical protein
LAAAGEKVKDLNGKAQDWAKANPALAIGAGAGATALLLAAGLVPLFAKLKGKNKDRAGKGRREGRFAKRAEVESENIGFESLADALEDEEFYAFLEDLADGAELE